MSQLTQSSLLINGATSHSDISSDGVHLSTRQPHSEHTKIRKTYIRRENQWKYINTSFFYEWRVLRQHNMIGCLVQFNGIDVFPSKVTDQYFEFNFKKIRERWFECLGMTETECKLIALEDSCMTGQLEAKFDYTIPYELAKGCVFSKRFEIYVKPKWKERTTDHHKVAFLEIEEEYVVSDIQKEQDKKRTKTE